MQFLDAVSGLAYSKVLYLSKLMFEFIFIVAILERKRVLMTMQYIVMNVSKIIQLLYIHIPQPIFSHRLNVYWFTLEDN